MNASTTLALDSVVDAHGRAGHTAADGVVGRPASMNDSGGRGAARGSRSAGRETIMVSWFRILVALVSLAVVLAAPLSAAAQQAAPPIPNPENRDLFGLDDLESYRQFSRVSNFEIVGHSYFKGPWVAPVGRGSGINTLRICGNVAYLGGYNPTVFGTLLVDISDPTNMQPLSFIAGNPGTRNAYLRVNCDRKILAVGHSESPENPNKPPDGQSVVSGVSFHDVSDPRNPVLLSFWANQGGRTHGMEMDDSYVYACGSSAQTKRGVEQLNIIQYTNPSSPELVATYHVPGQWQGEEYSEMNQLNPTTGTTQFVTCHEAIKMGDRLYLAYRDEWVVIMDIGSPAQPVRIGGLDLTPPFNGDPGVPLGCCPGAHTAQPVPTDDGALPRLMVLTDEHFSCPPGFARIVDISDPRNIQVLSTIHVAGVDDQLDPATGQFVCPPGQQSSHLPYFDPRSHGSLFYQAWYDQGLRAFDMSNPYAPKEVGYFISPDFSIPTQIGRHTREAFVDPATSLIYVTDGNVGGLTVLRYTGPMPTRQPLPGAR